MKTEVKLITPQIAEEMLKKNPMNRRVKDFVISEYSRVMKAGLWKENTGEAIKFASDGTLLDGQHRLTALIKANVSLYFLIITGIEKENFPVLDTTARRTAADVLYITGVHSAVQMSAGIKRYFVLKAGSSDFLKVRTTQISSIEVLKLYNTRCKFWEAATTMALNWYHKSQRMLSGSEILGLYAFFYDINNDDAFTFIDSLCNGELLDANNPIKQLRDKLIFSKMNTKFNLISSQRTAYVFKAWNLFRKGAKIHFLKYNPETDIYPIAV